MLINKREHGHRKLVPGGSSSSDSDSNTRRRFDFGLPSACPLVGIMSQRTRRPSRVTPLSLDFNFAGGEELGAGSNNEIQTDSANSPIG